MNKYFHSRHFDWIACVILGFILGYLAFDQRSEINRLRSELRSATERDKSINEALRRNLHSARESKTNSNGSNLKIVPVATKKESEKERSLEDLHKRRLAGEYLLESEDPTVRESRFAAAAAFAAMAFSNNVAKYSNMFAELGISSDQSQRLQKHLEKVVLASMLAESSLLDLQWARSSLKKRALEVLGEEGYDEYKRFEESRRAEREKRFFLEYLSERGMTLNPEQERQLVESIKEVSAYTQTSSSGPFDPLPAPAVGKEMVNEILTKQVSDLSEKAPALVGRLSEAGWSQENWQPVYDYYSKNISERVVTLSNIINRKIETPLERAEKDRARIQELKAAPQR